MAVRNFVTYSDALEGKALVDEIMEKEPTVPIISHSQLKSWDRCEFKWYLSYVEGWTQKEKSSALTLGSLIHEDCALWYSSGGDEAAIKALYAEHFTKYAYQDDAYHVLAEEMWLFDQYMEWSQPNDRVFQVEAVEEHFIFALWTPRGRKYYLQGYIDVRGLDTSNNNVRWLWDHKSTRKFWTLTEFDMDAQLPLYAAAYTLYGLPIFGVLLNQMNTYPFVKKENVNPEKLFKRDYNYLSMTQMTGLLTEVGHAVDDMVDRVSLIKAPVETHDGIEPGLYGSLTIPRRRMARDCSYCNFRGPCLDGLKGYNMQTSLEVDFVKKSDYAAHVEKKKEAHDKNPTKEFTFDLTFTTGTDYLDAQKKEEE